MVNLFTTIVGTRARLLARSIVTISQSDKLMEDSLPRPSTFRVEGPKEAAGLVELLGSRQTKCSTGSVLRADEDTVRNAYGGRFFGKDLRDLYLPSYILLTTFPINSASTFSPFFSEPSRVGRQSKAFAPLKLPIAELR